MTTRPDIVELQHALYASKNPTRRWLHSSRRDWILEALRRCAARGPHGTALEIGPGSGVYLPALTKAYDSVTASDIEAVYLEHIRVEDVTSRRNLQLVVDDITRSILPADRFDLILCTEVVEHLLDAKPALRAMHDLLRPGGFLVLSTPQKYCPLEMASKIAFLPVVIDLVRSIYREPILETGHINLMTAREAIEQVSAAGFEIEERFKSGLYLPLIAEFLGQRGLAFEQWLEGHLRGGLFDWALWTQYYVCRKPARAPVGSTDP